MFESGGEKKLTLFWTFAFCLRLGCHGGDQTLKVSRLLYLHAVRATVGVITQRGTKRGRDEREKWVVLKNKEEVIYRPRGGRPELHGEVSVHSRATRPQLARRPSSLSVAA